MKKIYLVAAIAAALSFAATAQQALSPEKLAELQAEGYTEWTPGQNRSSGPVFSKIKSINVGSGASKDTQTMQYDNGVIDALPTVFGQINGNRFSQGISGVALSTITLNSFSFLFAEDSTTDTNLFFQVADPLNATSISARASVNTPPLVNSGQSFSNPVFNTVPQTALGTTGMFNNTFFLGAWSLNANTTVPVDNETIGLSTNGPRQQGYTATSGTGPQPFSAQPFNAILRANVSSPNMVPVELMHADVE